MDYKEKYEQAFLRAKKLKETCDSNAVVGWMEYIFPELAESEDEKIRKDLINYLKSVLSNKKYGDKFIEDWIAWIEKQGDSNKEYWRGYREGKKEILDKYSELEKQGEQKKELLQELDNKLNNAFKNETPESLKKFLNEQKPVDKIQIGKKYKCIASPRYTTFRVGEIYKPEDRFLCSLMNFCSACFKPIEDDEQKPAWSEEDEKMLNDILMCCEHHCYLDAGNIDWLKNLKERYSWKPSDEQMKELDEVIRNPYLSTAEYNGLIALREQLKAL